MRLFWGEKGYYKGSLYRLQHGVCGLGSGMRVSCRIIFQKRLKLKAQSFRLKGSKGASSRSRLGLEQHQA